jgi:hypothetical protein
MERKHLFILLFVLVTFGCAQQNNTIKDGKFNVKIPAIGWSMFVLN